MLTQVSGKNLQGIGNVGGYMRRCFLDHLRWMAVLLLFPYHTFMIYNSFGENFYIKGANVSLTTGIMIAIGPWFMPLLFVIAGMSSAFALQKRTAMQYIKERISKLLIPLLSGVLLLIPVQTFFAERFHNGYTGGYFQQYILFFTKPTDLSGYTGGFTPGHLWFIFYLFVISLVALPMMSAYQRANRKLSFQKVNLPLLLLLFLLPLFGTFIVNIKGKSLGEYFVYFLLGCFFLFDENVLEKVDKHRFLLLILSALSMTVVLLCWCGVFGDIPDIVYDIFSHFYAWAAILSLMGMGRHCLNFKNKVTDYFSTSSFSVYIFHQSWIVAVAYCIFMLTDNILMQIILIMTVSILATFATYELCKRTRITRFLFGIKSPN
ncbi:MAG: acyltransferase family protein [Oscillospiraceae bacterium]|nr:acyltransferase family protein [Oscillospiraceae bacterium]